MGIIASRRRVLSLAIATGLVGAAAAATLLLHHDPRVIHITTTSQTPASTVTLDPGIYRVHTVLTNCGYIGWDLETLDSVPASDKMIVLATVNPPRTKVSTSGEFTVVARHTYTLYSPTMDHGDQNCGIDLTIAKQ